MESLSIKRAVFIDSGSEKASITQSKSKMKIFQSILVVVALSLAILSVVAEEKKAEKKERNFRGELACAKCTLKEAKSCQAALTVQRKNKQGEQIKRVILLKNNETAKAFHDNICSPGDKVAVRVTGVIEGKQKNRMIVASKIEKAKVGKKKAPKRDS